MLKVHSLKLVDRWCVIEVAVLIGHGQIYVVYVVYVVYVMTDGITSDLEQVEAVLNLQKKFFCSMLLR